ncbi:MAG: hypothetical protein ACRDT2_07380 [Natronosporangium sp.]
MVRAGPRPTVRARHRRTVPTCSASGRTGGDRAGGPDRLLNRWHRLRLPDRWHWLRLPDRWRRPVPRPVVAAVSAVVAGTAVAVYLNSTADPPPPLQPVPVLAPESWLDVQDQRGGFDPFGSDLPTPPPDRMVAAHPAEAVTVVPLTLYGSALVALPPGDYQVRASCELSGSPLSLPDPVPVEVMVVDSERVTFTSGEVSCDGAVWPVAEPVTIVDYRAFYVHYGVAAPPGVSDTYDPYLDLEQAGPVLVVSVTPVR